MAIGRIMLHSTSRMSLNDRFTGLQIEPSNRAGAAGVRQIVSASRKNQKLAEQMENRPAVVAALRAVLKQDGRGRTRAGGLLRGATGATGGVVKVGGTVSGGRRGRGVGRGRGRGARSAVTPAAVTTRLAAATTGRGRGSNFRGRGMRGNTRRGGRNEMSNGSNVPSVKQRLAVQGRLSQPTRGYRGGNRGANRGSSAPANFRDRLSAGPFRSDTTAGPFRSDTTAGPFRSDTREVFPTRTFRGRGRGSTRGGRGRGSTRGGRGGYWQ